VDEGRSGGAPDDAIGSGEEEDEDEDEDEEEDEDAGHLDLP